MNLLLSRLLSKIMKTTYKLFKIIKMSFELSTILIIKIIRKYVIYKCHDLF